MNLPAAEAFILQKLHSKLSKDLYYHGPHHALDVAESAIRLARAEGISDEESLTLLRTAAFFHDAGFITVYKGHEAEGCRMAREYLPQFGYNSEQINRICGMIEATKIPQSPRNLLEEIICDADLDYLGRDDFEPIADSLYRELKARNMVVDQQAWDAKQIQFLENHHYRTATALATRQTTKLIHLQRLKETNLPQA